MSSKQSGKIAKATEDHIKSYRRIREKGDKFLEGHVDFDKTIDAIRAVDIGVKGERQIMSGLVSAQLVYDLINIIHEEVDDEEVLRRISAKAARLAVQYAE